MREDDAVNPHRALLDRDGIDRLRTAFAGYTVDGVHAQLGASGQIALARGDLAGVRRVLDPGPAGALVRLFLLGEPVAEGVARHALAPLELGVAQAAGLVTASGGLVRAAVDIRPYAQAGAGGSGPWWVVSDFGSDVRPGPLSPDHVLGVGAASLTLAQATVREPVDRALDLGTGCGIQALHLSAHAGSVTGTDVSDRALRFAATTAALSGLDWDLRGGSLLEPVAAERFDLVVANPPFVVSPGYTASAGGYDYRDGGLPGDGVCRELVTRLPTVLTAGGTAQLLANWIVPSGCEWEDRIHGWLAGCGCDAWVWQRELADPGEYVAMWLRDAGEVPGTARWTQRYDTWLDWFVAHDVAAVGMGLVTMWRTDTTTPLIVCQDVPQALEQPIGHTVPGWLARQRWLVQAGGMRWDLEADDAVAAVVAGCDGTRRLGELCAVLAAAVGLDAASVRSALAPVVRDLVGRGFLLPPELATSGAAVGSVSR